MNLTDLGWNKYFEESFKSFADKDYIVGKIFIEQRHLYGIYTELGEYQGEISGKMRYEAEKTGDFPVVGDFVVLTPIHNEKKAIIHAVLPRKSKFSRKAAGVQTNEQVLASNFDTVFIVTSLNGDLSLRRLERYLTMAYESNANPVIVLSKADLCTDIEGKLCQVEAVAIGTPIHVISTVDGRGIDDIKKYLKNGMTAVVLGSSGVGKSTLINYIAGEELLLTGSIREYDDTGRHTTTHRQLVKLPTGGFIIDTPGLREFQLWDGSEGIQETFKDIQEIAKGCKFRDCRHDKEIGCAVKAAIEEGILDAKRLESYNKLQRELRYLEGKQNQLIRMNGKKRVKDLCKAIKNISKKR
ncbi:ribosome biogenesis GTPase [Caloramator quimbayensis]|uniref:Small ribosomal subunit biogenesis GTPase RsgA n=1 Tax=Caloramator quimbayensis TaxID=1147123 RepID=A0A1T4XTF9_9CLOT|nr:ribosome small subunit-dependent GTPase A [Caloramator quimbayensis]SKA92849.1 ribosome biogenesis GTPase [Caloramator quimbayensis]